MKRLLQFMKKNLWCYVIGVSAMIASITLDMFSPYLMKIIVDDVIQKGNLNLFKWLLGGLAGITISRAFLGYLKEYMFDYSSSDIIVSLRKSMFDHIQRLSFSFFDRTNTGELMSRMKEDTENVLHATAFGIMLISEMGITFIAASVILFFLNWKLASVCLLTMPFIAYIAVQLEKKVGESFGKISDQRAVLNTTAQENIAGVRLVKAFGRERYEIQKFLLQNKVSHDLNIEQAEVFAKYHPLIELLSNIVVVLVTTAGGILTIGGDISIGTLVAFSTYIYALIWPMRMIGWLTNVLAQCLASLKKIDKIFEEHAEIENCEEPNVPEKLTGHVVFENVSFQYGEIPVLKNINLNAKPGATIGIMGMTGSGKSTLANLIGRYYDTSSGKILVDGMDIKKLDLKKLRENISVVMQDTFLFSDTIEDNIKLGVGKVHKSEFHSAVKDSNVEEFVSKMQKGYKTIIGERGIGLSGGQKQRISIARALLKGSKILILDDATSALDMETEYDIQKALEHRNGITKFIIAHRISAVKNADEILILENGEIVERGNHEFLLELKGRYYDTFCEQFGDMMLLSEEEVV
ncbi:MAG: ABC transporter ATP-binding protein/permease [Clostridia bacterium]|nr:ABC transporter ATP-binding protein/permease [Clostridia bacterium]